MDLLFSALKKKKVYIYFLVKSKKMAGRFLARFAILGKTTKVLKQPSPYSF